jgi:hypothetical protein
MKSVAVGDFLTDDQGQHIIRLWRELGSSPAFITRAVEEVIRPNIEEINTKLGQLNDERFIAYALEFALIQADRR